MEAIAAISLAGTIVQFIDAGSKLIMVAAEIRESTSGMSRETERVETTARRMRDLSIKYDTSTSDTCHSDDAHTLKHLAHECYDLSERILHLVQSTVPKDRKSMHLTLLAAFKQRVYRPELKQLEHRLGDCRSQLHLYLDHLTKCVITYACVDKHI
jgi:hypothetical protein